MKPVHDKLVFMDKEKEEEWNELPESIKKSVISNLKESASMMESRVAIEMLCLIIMDMNKRVEELERKCFPENSDLG